MRRKFTIYLICGCAAMILGAFPVQADTGSGFPNTGGVTTDVPDTGEEDAGDDTGNEDPDPKSTEQNGENGGDVGEAADDNKKADDEKNKNDSGQTDLTDGIKGQGDPNGETTSDSDTDSTNSGEGAKESDDQGWLSKLFSEENRPSLVIAAAVAAAAIGAGIFLCLRSSRKKEQQRQEEARRQKEENRRVEQQRMRGQEAKEREAARKREAESAAAVRQSGERMAVDETEVLKTSPPVLPVQAGAAALSRPSAALPDASRGTIGKVHHIGSRRNQQDTMGTAPTRLGLLAVVSDGMGGLSDGEKVSQQAVQSMLQAAGRVAVSGEENPLFVMLSEANEEVLQMLGPDRIYKSGATLLAVLVNNSQFHWAAVGDSRIYLYCSGHLLQLNREHIYKQQLIGEAVNKNISFNRVNTDPQRDRLVSFLGMGELKWVDGSLRPVDVKQGDKLLLMSDGIFNTISESEIIRILENTRNAADAAALMEQRVLAAGNPKQDNFTCVILDF